MRRVQLNCIQPCAWHGVAFRQHSLNRLIGVAEVGAHLQFERVQVGNRCATVRLWRAGVKIVTACQLVSLLDAAGDSVVFEVFCPLDIVIILMRANRPINASVDNRLFVGRIDGIPALDGIFDTIHVELLAIGVIADPQGDPVFRQAAARAVLRQHQLAHQRGCVGRICGFVFC